jgi:hypothetical protein
MAGDQTIAVSKVASPGREPYAPCGGGRARAASRILVPGPGIRRARAIGRDGPPRRSAARPTGAHPCLT